MSLVLFQRHRLQARYEPLLAGADQPGIYLLLSSLLSLPQRRRLTATNFATLSPLPVELHEKLQAHGNEGSQSMQKVFAGVQRPAVRSKYSTTVLLRVVALLVAVPSSKFAASCGRFPNSNALDRLQLHANESRPRSRTFRRGFAAPKRSKRQPTFVRCPNVLDSQELDAAYPERWAGL